MAGKRKDFRWTGADLVDWRERMHLSQAEAATVLGLAGRDTIGQIERGRRHADGLPAWLVLLCRYAERFGAI